MIWIVTGMHRSGTSLVAGLLHNTGIHFGDEKTFLPKPDADNSLGFFENIRFRSANDYILKQYKYSVKDWKLNIPEVKANRSLAVKSKTLIKEYNSRFENWGAKDPRFCLTWPSWNFDPNKTIIVLAYRNPNEVAESLLKRNKLPIEAGLELWNIYNLRALRMQENFNLVKVNYEKVLQGSEIPDEKSLIEFRLRHNMNSDIPENCKDTWALLDNPVNLV